VNKEFIISSDKSMIRIEDVIAMLRKSYWAAARSEEIIIKSIENSFCFGVYHNNKQIGFARMITDYATYAYLCDVIIDEEYRGQGIGKELVGYIMEHPELVDVKSLWLSTSDAHKLYEKYGFERVNDISKLMIKRKKSINR
jgi:N-acetylglutamate synthase-like GNAT family acetyltransferase